MKEISRMIFLKGLAGLLAEAVLPDYLFAASEESLSKEMLQKDLEPYLDDLSKKVITLESDWDAEAHHKKSHARGLMQIKPVVLKEWLLYGNGKVYTKSDLFKPLKNVELGRWYLDERIGGHYIPFYGMSNNPETKLACYRKGPPAINDLGIKDATKDFKKLPPEVKDYLRRYRKLL